MKALTAILFALPVAVDAQSRQCGPHSAVTSHLLENYAETRHMLGLAANNSVLELFVSDSGTWTITATNRAGVTCLLASGTAADMTVVQPGVDG